MMSISDRAMKGVESMMSEFGRELLLLAGRKYGFDGSLACEELMSSCVVEKGKRSKKVVGMESVKEGASVPLPFVGVVVEGCKGIKFNHGLHTQCGKEGEEYCVSCQKQADKNASGKPNYGDIRDRVKEGVSLLEWRDAKGKQTVPYANVVKKLGLDKEVCLREAEKWNVEIPAEHWVERVAKRGRPSCKKVVESETSSVVSSVKKEKGTDLLEALRAAADESEKSSVASSTSSKRGRKRLSDEEKAEREAGKAEAKAAKAAEREAAKVAKAEAKAAKAAEREAAKAAKAAERDAAKAEAKAAKAGKSEKKSVTINETPVEIPEEFRGCAAPELAMAEAEKETEELECEEFVHDGVTYWKAGNTLYDPESQDEVGVWDPKEGKIVREAESDDELSEEELSDDE